MNKILLIIFLCFGCQREFLSLDDFESKLVHLMLSNHQVELTELGTKASSSGDWSTRTTVSLLRFISVEHQVMKRLCYLTPYSSLKAELYFATECDRSRDSARLVVDRAIVLRKGDVLSIELFRGQEKNIFSFADAFKTIKASFYLPSFTRSKDTRSWRERSPCQQFDEQCEILVDECHQCPHGTYALEGGKCPHRRDRFCGQLNCGTKNQPACLRSGDKFWETINCEVDEMAVYCAENLLPYCDSSGVVICL